MSDIIFTVDPQMHTMDPVEERIAIPCQCCQWIQIPNSLLFYTGLSASLLPLLSNGVIFRSLLFVIKCLICMGLAVGLCNQIFLPSLWDMKYRNYISWENQN